MKKFREKQTGILSSIELKTFKGKLLYCCFFAVLIIFSIAAIIPALWTVLTAFKSTQEIYGSFSFFPKDLTLEKAMIRISESWAALDMSESVLNTFILSVGSLFFRIVVCGFGGYALSKIKPKGAKVIFTLAVWTMMMPGQIRIVPNYITYLHFPFAYDFSAGVSLLDTFWPMWLQAGSDVFSMLLFKNAFDGISKSYAEAAKIDGCSNYGIFFKIMVPLVTPVVIYVSINLLSLSWEDFFTPLLVLDEKIVVPLKVYRLKENSSIQMNTYFMALVFASIPLFVIYAVFQRYIFGGINVGGVKE